MATRDFGRGGDATAVRHCSNCGAIATGMRFCAECGQPVEIEGPTREFGPFEGHQTKARRVAADVNTGHIPSADELFGPDQARQSHRGLVIGGVIAAVAVAAIAAAVVLLVSSNGSSSSSAYSTKLSATFAPVTRSNRALSGALSRLRGHNVSGAERAVANAKAATAGARGALGALAVPTDSHELASLSRQALDRESSYLTAVSVVLAHPSSPTASQMQSLAGNLTSALDAVGDPIVGASQAVSGDDALVAWAQRAKKTSSPGSQSGSGGAHPTNPLANGRDCGGGLFAGPNTTCEFAQNVRSAYDEAPGASATVRVFSPVTQQTYTMDCTLAGSGVTCSGGNNASASWTP